MKFKKNNSIGIWGYGVVGKAITHYFHNQGYQVSIIDKRNFTSEEIAYFQQKKINFYHETQKNKFFNSSDYLFSSPGINIVNDYQTYKHKWIQELDFFASTIQKPIIAVTGSIGKTSVTHMLASLLKLAHIPTCVGGNIGIATFDLLAHKHSVDYALLEVSSFQLHYCQTFAPQLAIWTNFYPNHLDHHATENEYCLAKYNIMQHQMHNQHALMHISLYNRIPKKNNHYRSYVSAEKPSFFILQQLSSYERMYYLENNIIMRYANNIYTPIIPLNNALLTFSFVENIILVAAACDILNLDTKILYQLPLTTQLPEHRLEKVATINNVDFYNDSKSTTTASTLAAVKKLHDRPLHLFLGGLSKGVDRASFIAQLKTSVHYVYCFGNEADTLYKMCTTYNIPAQQFSNLETAFNACINTIQNKDVVLFSPAGSSYDLYTNFEERGIHFKKLIALYKTSCSK